jgi:GAF domain-containing protein
VRHEKEKTKSELAVPIKSKQRVVGVLDLQSDKLDAFDEIDIAAMEALGAQVAIAIENAHLFKESRIRAERLAVVNRIAKTASTILHPDDLMEAVCREVISAFQADAFFIALYDEKANELDYCYLVDEGVRHPPERYSMSTGLSPIVVKEKRPLVIRDAQEYKRLQPKTQLFGTEKLPESWLGAPMLVGERVLGVINVQSYRPHVWDEEDELLLFTIADQVAIALANARLFEETRTALNETKAQTRSLALLNEMSEQLNYAASLDEILNVAATKTNQILSSDRTSVSLLNAEGDCFQVFALDGEEVTWPVGAQLPVKETDMGTAVRERRLLIYPDIHSDRLGDLRAYMIAPLVAGGRAIGTLNVASKTPNFYTQRDQGLLLQVATLLSSAIANRNLFEETQRRATQLALINDIGGRIAAVLDLDSVLDRAALLMQGSFGYHHVALFTLNQERDELIMRARAGDFAHLFPPDHRLKLGQGIVGWASRHGETLLANDVRAESHYINLYPDVISTLSELGVPIRADEEIVGVLDVQSPQINAFDENDVLVMETLADQIAVAIKNARLYEKVQQELAERKQAEKALEQKAQELTRSNTELEQFAYLASHDLQEPLRMVQSYLQLLERRYKEQLDSDAQEFIWFAVDGADRMRTLINDLLTYSRVTTRARPLVPTDCAAILDLVLTDLKVAIEESGAAVTHDPLPTVMADVTQVKQVFQNLVSNGIKFREEDTRPEIHVGAEQRDGEWIFSVRDNGIGIDPQHFEQIFVIFKRLHSRDEYPGTGIGLAVCKKIIERHGGRMWVESEPGQGATFYFTIPEGI